MNSCVPGSDGERASSRGTGTETRLCRHVSRPRIQREPVRTRAPPGGHARSRPGSRLNKTESSALEELTGLPGSQRPRGVSPAQANGPSLGAACLGLRGGRCRKPKCGQPGGRPAGEAGLHPRVPGAPHRPTVPSRGLHLAWQTAHFAPVTWPCLGVLTLLSGKIRQTQTALEGRQILERQAGDYPRDPGLFRTGRSTIIAVACPLCPENGSQGLQPEGIMPDANHEHKMLSDRLTRKRILCGPPATQQLRGWVLFSPRRLPAFGPCEL
ncbi:uncharacterized protein LOC128314164 [Acinonyx jubatus]|uniref:Uncharacterized protein LOC128314164 n=1 Tax=Acinonyx jubatus TaxID=32536 RepID=A0ABM3PK19_ACIJB|nr:uncharacterized protein LOC128314164 [Acinonyx jubatus]